MRRNHTQDTVTADELAAMRWWIDDVGFRDLTETETAAADLSDQEVLDGVAHHHVGGIEKFLEFYREDG